MGADQRTAVFKVRAAAIIAAVLLTPLVVGAASAQAAGMQPSSIAKPQVAKSLSGAETILKSSSAPTQELSGIAASGVFSPAPQPSSSSGTAGPTQPGEARVSVSSAIGAQVRAVIDQTFPTDPAKRRRYEKAASVFPAFCQDWQRMLHDREVNNRQHLDWREKNGYETATYVGYGNVESCECKASEGMPIGKIRYEERDYYLTGKTIEEALRAAPKLTGVTSTLEIFSWEKNKWFY